MKSYFLACSLLQLLHSLAFRAMPFDGHLQGALKTTCATN